MRKPNFFIVGAPKCGTTSMAEYLRQHPDVFMPLEELQFFSKEIYSNPNLILKNKKDYLECFSEARSKNFLEKIKDNKYIIEKHKAIYKNYPLRKSIMIRRVGVLYLLNGDLKEARRHFFKAIKIAPWYLRNWINLIVSFFGIKVYKRTIFLKQKFSGIFY